MAKKNILLVKPEQLEADGLSDVSRAGSHPSILPPLVLLEEPSPRSGCEVAETAQLTACPLSSPGDRSPRVPTSNNPPVTMNQLPLGNAPPTPGSDLTCVTGSPSSEPAVTELVHGEII